MRIFLIGLFVAGCSYGTYRLYDILMFSSNAVTTEGRILSRDAFVFTIEYEVDGTKYRITEDLPSTKGMSGLDRAKLQPGAAVQVLYDPALPADGRWDSKRNWIFPAAILFVSLLAGLAGFFPHVIGKSFRKRE